MTFDSEIVILAHPHSSCNFVVLGAYYYSDIVYRDFVHSVCRLIETDMLLLSYYLSKMFGSLYRGVIHFVQIKVRFTPCSILLIDLASQNLCPPHE